MHLIPLIIMAAVVAEILLIIFLPVVGWSVISLIGLVILLALFVPVGVHASYIDKKFALSAKVNGFEIKLFPKKTKEKSGAEGEGPSKQKKPKKEKPAKTDENSSSARKLALNFEEILEIVKKALKGLSKFGKLTVHKFMLHYVAAGKDPYNTAMTYGYVNAALSSLAPVCARSFKVKNDVDVWTNVDFTQEEMFLEAELSITLRLAQVVHVALVAGLGVLGVLIKNKRRLHKEKRAEVKANKNSASANNTDDNKETNIKTEERTESNG